MVYLLARGPLTGHGIPVTIRSHLLSRRPGLVHGFTGRTDAAGRSLDLGTGVCDSTWDLAAADVGASGWTVARASQVHGTTVLRAEQGGLAGQGDAVVTQTPGVLAAVRVADCVPILVAGDGIVAAVHAGWRGLAAGIIAEAVSALGACGPLVAAVGPRICVDCYEVGDEVVEGIGRLVPTDQFVHLDGLKPHVDLGTAAAHQLRASGVDQVDVLMVCSRCDPRFWSHREEGPGAGRQAGIVGLQC